jgi:outer membrane protein
MKRLLPPLVALVALSVAGAVFAADGIKLASVDLRKIAQESKAGAEAAKELSKVADKLEKGMKQKEAELDKIKDALEGKGKKLTAKEKTAKEKELRKKLEAYREMAKDAQHELQTKEDEYGNKLMEKLDKIIKEFAPKNGFALVIRKGDLIYTDGKNEMTDITADILKLLNGPPQEEAPKK